MCLNSVGTANFRGCFCLVLLNIACRDKGYIKNAPLKNYAILELNVLLAKGKRNPVQLNLKWYKKLDIRKSRHIRFPQNLVLVNFRD